MPRFAARNRINYPNVVRWSDSAVYFASESQRSVRFLLGLHQHARRIGAGDCNRRPTAAGAILQRGSRGCLVFKSRKPSFVRVHRWSLDSSSVASGLLCCRRVKVTVAPSTRCVRTVAAGASAVLSCVALLASGGMVDRTAAAIIATRLFGSPCIRQRRAGFVRGNPQVQPDAASARSASSMRRRRCSFMCDPGCWLD